MSETEPFIYDEVPYPSFVFPQTHPDRLATMGRFMGIGTTDPDKCRFLELGCGDGTNICSHAYSLPNSSFVGIDLSTVEIDSAKRTAADLELSNIEFVQGDVTDLDLENLGEFDFIIAHGLYSWVPGVVRDAILNIYQQCLAPNGIGYISYNALPGCHIRRISSEIMQYHSRLETDALNKVGRGIEGLRAITTASASDSVYQAMLSLELDQIVERTPENVFHDDHSVINQPFYFHEFCSMIGKHDLAFVCEAEPSDMLDKGLSDEAIKILDSLSGTPTERTQYRDLITGRRFRSSLICKASQLPTTSPKLEEIDRSYISTQLTSTEDARFDDNSAVRFDSASGNNLKLNHPLTKFVLIHLERVRPETPSFENLIEAARTTLGDDHVNAEHIDRLRGFLIQLFLAGFIKLHSLNLGLNRDISEHPIASKFARWQLSRGSKTVTTLGGANLEIEIPAVAKLITLLDGTNDQSEIALKIKEEFAPHQLSADIERMVEDNLKSISNARLLVG